MSIFNEYLTGEEREVALENARLQNEYDKLSTVYEMLNLQVEQMRRDAEMKVFEESGTYDDLTFLYQEAENEIGEQKKNVFQKIVDWFKKIFAAIGNKIKSIFGSKVEEIEVPADVVEKSSLIEKAWNEMQNGIAKLRNGDVSGALNILKVVAIPAAVGGAVAGGAVAVKKMKKGEFEGLTKKMEEIRGNLENLINSVTGKIMSFFGKGEAQKENDARECFNPLKKLLDAVKSVIDSRTGGIAKAAGAVKNAVTGNKENNDESKPEDTANTDYAKKAAENGVTVRKFGGFEYRIDKTTGHVTKVDAQGNETDVQDNQVPSQLQKLVQKTKGKAAAAAQEKETVAQANNQAKADVRAAKKTFKVMGTDGKKHKVLVNKQARKMYYVNDDGTKTEINRSNLFNFIPKGDNGDMNSAIRKKIVASVAESSSDVIPFDEVNQYFSESTDYDVEMIESTVEDEIEEIKSQGYVVESTDTYYSIKETTPVHNLTVQESVFGIDISGEIAQETAEDVFDAEIMDLMKDFATI